MKLESVDEFRTALLNLKSRIGDAGHTNGLARKVNLQEIEQALRRIETGTYGICVSCSLVMPKGELLMRPCTETCNSCRSRQLRAA